MTESPDNQALDQQLQAYLDGQMKGRQAGEFERRLQADEPLRRELELYRSLDSALHQEPRGAAEVDYDLQRQDIMSAVERRVLLAGLPRGRTIRLFPAAAMAVAALLLLAVLPTVRLLTQAPPATADDVATMDVLRIAGESPAGQVEVRISRPRRPAASLANLHRSPLPAGTVLAAVGPPEGDVALPYMIGFEYAQQHSGER